MMSRFGNFRELLSSVQFISHQKDGNVLLVDCNISTQKVISVADMINQTYINCIRYSLT